MIFFFVRWKNLQTYYAMSIYYAMPTTVLFSPTHLKRHNSQRKNMKNNAIKFPTKSTGGSQTIPKLVGTNSITLVRGIPKDRKFVSRFISLYLLSLYAIDTNCFGDRGLIVFLVVFSWLGLGEILGYLVSVSLVDKAVVLVASVYYF